MNTDNTNDIRNNTPCADPRAENGTKPLSDTTASLPTEVTSGGIDISGAENNTGNGTLDNAADACPDEAKTGSAEEDIITESGIEASANEASDNDTAKTSVSEDDAGVSADGAADEVKDSAKTVFSPPELSDIQEDATEGDTDAPLLSDGNAEDGELTQKSAEDSTDGSTDVQEEINITDAADSADGKSEKKAKKEGYDPDHPRGIDAIFDFVELFVFSLVAVLVVTTFFFRHSIVEGSSMEQTLFEGEHLIISNLFYNPERGDIIVCEDYSTTLRKPIVKRVIGVAGDRVQVFVSGEVYVNGELLQEDYVYVDFYLPNREVDIIVPEGEIFVMGDHRNMSTDSREIGTVDEDSVLGKVLFRFYPFDKFGKVE